MGKSADEGVSLPEVCERLAQLLDGQARIERQVRDAEAGSSERLGRLEQEVGALLREDMNLLKEWLSAVGLRMRDDVALVKQAVVGHSRGGRPVQEGRAGEPTRHPFDRVRHT